jgi:hypothetical protein
MDSAFNFSYELIANSILNINVAPEVEEITPEASDPENLLEPTASENLSTTTETASPATTPVETTITPEE